MKKLAIGAIAALTTAFSVTAAQAHICYAHSRVAYGWGSAAYLRTARTIALANCSIRTPRGMMCWITSCR